MPKLLFFGICQKVLEDSQERLISMINLMSGFRLGVRAKEPVPPAASVPMAWAAVCSWLRASEDEGKTFQPKTEIVSPSGEIKISSEGQPFAMKEGALHTWVVGQGFPVAEQGIYSIKLFLREVGTEAWEEVSSFPFDVMHIEQKDEPDE